MEVYKGVDRRRFRRLENEFDVSYGGNMTITRNISAGGVSIYTDRAYPEGSILNLVINLPSEGGFINPVRSNPDFRRDAAPSVWTSNGVKAKARVVWSRKFDGKYRTGMEYIEIEGADVAIFYAQAAMEKRIKEAEKQKGKEVEKVSGKPEEETKPKISAKDMNIMVVDDEQIILDMLTRILGIRGYNVICAKDGFEALDLAKDKRIDLAFIDVKLPGGMNGVGTFRMLKKEKPDIKAVMITGFSVEQEIAEAIKNGAVGALRKPFDNIEEIYNMIDKNLKENMGGG